MSAWEVWKQDDGGRRLRMSVHDDRVQALARVLVLESQPAGEQTHWLAGPPEPACRTNRDLYVRLVDDGERMNANGRSLDEFLRAWWLVSRHLSGRTQFDLDTVAAMVAAATTVTPAPISPAWRSASFTWVDEPISYAHWEAIVLSQIADLADFADQGPLDAYAAFGINAPRPPGRQRATDSRWYNFDPKAYLECGMAGSLGGWDEADGLREPVSGAVIPLMQEPGPSEWTIDTISWNDLATLTICGQMYE
jgi:hypothetical protein